MLENLTGWEGIGLIYAVSSFLLMVLLLCFWLVMDDRDN